MPVLSRKPNFCFPCNYINHDYFFSILPCAKVNESVFTFIKCSYCNCHIACKCKEWHKYRFWSQITKNVFCPQSGCFGCRWAMSARCCMDAVQTQWPWELMVCGCAACHAAAYAPVSEVSTDMEMWIYELTFILVSLAV